MTSARLITPKQTRAIRHAVLWPHKSGVDACVIPELDELDSTFHVGCFLNEELCGTSTVFPQPHEKIVAKNPYRLRAMGVNRSVQGKGVGATIVHEIVQELKERNCDLLWCDAREIATVFYQKLGFEIVHGPYDIPVIGPHFLMALRIV